MEFYELGVIIAFILSIVSTTIWLRNTVDIEDTSEVFNSTMTALIVVIVASFLSWASVAALIIIKTTIVVSDYYKNKKETK